MNRTFFTRLIVAFVLTFVPAACNPAHAAMDITSDAGPLFNPITRRQLERYISMLQADREQRDSMLVLYKGYRNSLEQQIAEHTKKADEHEKELEKAQKPIRHLSSHEIVEAFIKQTDALDESFLQDCKSLLSESQARQFDGVVRAHHRDAGLRFAVMAGEGLDLCTIARTAGVDRSTPMVADAFLEYENAVDRLLLEKRAVLLKLFRTVAKSETQTDSPDMEVMNNAMKELASQSMKVRESNRTHARLIGSMLTDAQKKVWDEEIRRVSYPAVYAKSGVHKALDSAFKHESMNDELRAQLQTIGDNYDRDAEPINTRWAAAIDEKQSIIADKGIATMMMFGESLKDDDALMAAHKARRGLETQSLDRIKALLGKTRAESLKIDEFQSHDDAMDSVMSFGDEVSSYDEYRKENEGNQADE